MKLKRFNENIDPFKEKEWDYEELDVRTYKIYVEEVNYGFIEVDAKDEEEAQDLANELYEEGNVTWGRSNVNFNVDN